MRALRVHFLPELVPANELADSHVVVIDVLRATTTITCALAAGASAVVPCLTIDDARRQAAALGPGQAVLGGERGGLPIEGFDLGNSPAEYTPASVAGKTVIFTTTNGTKALLHSQKAARIYVGALVNLSAVEKVLKDSPRADLVCAGTNGQITHEDVLLAGALAARLGADRSWQLSDQAAIARDAWLHVSGSGQDGEPNDRLLAALRASRGGRNLVEIGMAADIELACQVDRLAIVPCFDPARLTIRSLTERP